ncbi:hypothetical protein RRG08_046428 [Elysia crispata]|uniref:Uncharacterized protein n=1 Tax=Elysia crispata TaxID=231223 RepID=A0AAE1DCX1_9GAST|nr:hypothetical protein RRG08_046428 [Elysia crispata]
MRQTGLVLSPGSPSAEPDSSTTEPSSALESLTTKVVFVQPTLRIPGMQHTLISPDHQRDFLLPLRLILPPALSLHFSQSLDFPSLPEPLFSSA